MLGLRFLLELCALVAFGRYGYEEGGFAGMLVLPISAAAIWGVFDVPSDPSRSGEAPLRVPGLVRLCLELAFFGAAMVLLSRTGWRAGSPWLGGAALALYTVGNDRIAWLLKH
jgi:hypothetical protein